MSEFPHPYAPIHWPLLVEEELIQPTKWGLHRTAIVEDRPFQAESIRRWSLVTIAHHTGKPGEYELVGYFELESIMPFEFPLPSMVQWDKTDALGLDELAQNEGFDTYEDLYRHYESKARAEAWTRKGYYVVRWGAEMEEEEAVRRMRADPFNIVGFLSWDRYYEKE